MWFERDMNTARTALVHKLSSVVLFLVLVGVVWLLAREWIQVKQNRGSPPAAATTVAARSETPDPPPPKVRENHMRVERSPTVAHPAEIPKPVVARQPVSASVETNSPKPVESQARNPYTVRLADGREVTFGGLSYGLEHNYVHERSGAKSQPGMHNISIKSDSPSLVAWLLCKGGQGSFLQADFVSVIDEAGREAELSRPSSIFNPAELETVGAWQISNFPRRDAKIGIRFYSRDPAYKVHRMAEFWAPNPAPRKYPVWSVESGPVVKREGEVEYRLVNLVTDEPIYNATQPGPTPRTAWTTSIFRVASRAQPATRWNIESIALSDAAGNVSIPDDSYFNRVGDFLIFSFNRAFWSSETTGKIKAAFTRSAGFSSNELVTLKNLPVPSGTNSTTIQTQKKVGEVALHLEQLRRHMPPVRMSSGQWNLELTAALIPETPGLHVCIAEVSDQTGERISPGVTHKLPNGRQSFLFHTAPATVTLNITFAIQKSHVVEFLASLQQEGGLEQLQQLKQAGVPIR